MTLDGRLSSAGSAVGDRTSGVEPFFLPRDGGGCGVASEALLFAGGSRRPRGGILRFSAMMSTQSARIDMFKGSERENNKASSR